jgi:hypothetical protein
MGNYKITTGISFNLDELFPKYTVADMFPIRPNNLSGLTETLFQISEQRNLLPDNAPLVIFETNTYQYRIENRNRSYDNDVYFTLHKIHNNDLRTVVSSTTVDIDQIEELITQHIASNLEWERV